MNNVKLRQKKNQETRSYEIIEGGVKVEFKKAANFQSYVVKFENIGFEEVIVKHKPEALSAGLYVSVLINMVLVIAIIIQFFKEELLRSPMFPTILTSGVLGGMSVWAVSLFKTQYDKYLKGAESLVFFYGDKEKKEVDDFISVLKEGQRKYIRNKYMIIDDLLPVENQKEIFLWLYQMKFISRDELEMLLENLNNIRITKGL